MANTTRVHCKRCKKHKGDVGDLTWRGYCETCSLIVREQVIDDMHYHRGEYFDRWRRAMAACVGGVLLDDDPPAP